ncbi:DUF3006 domain-containing protein [Paenibacillus sp. RUD330]|uniref:DUF3006 domain-containing protein n=2 Tax=unclassified Paenibacillus TaxID=185978 RepID=UPI000B926908|nr:DUF3006 domain-containing protein [Paenibacillus sp. RUD330]ASS66990.1 DUF3006 domain-containing protein [Paenibacillus sp. RUD330]
MKGIVDRFEGEFVVIEINGVTKDFARSEVDSAVEPGDSVILIDGKWVTDDDETKSRVGVIKELMKDVWED